ncbi:MAG: amidohydrolase family protein [Planctomycetota bacterium]|nr:amidohydrolase family protein [Planctomycetaceae bacterium]MDQ3330045.1 amidohydrolase family protein [Planctomycetota bacterium]
MKRLALVLSTALFTAAAIASDAIPAARQDNPVALVNAAIYPVSGPAIEGGTIVFADGKITAVGKDVEIPDDAERIDLKGQRVYPSLFEAMSDVGLVEIDAVRATIDKAETGSLNPNVKAWVSVNPDSEVIPVTRSNGVLIAVTAPSGGLISGQAGVLQLDGWTYEDLTLKAPVGLVVNWPRIRNADDKPHTALDRAFDDARAYLKARQAKPDLPMDLRHEAIALVINREVPLIVAADELEQIQSAVAFADKQNVKLIIDGGYDAPLCANLLAAKDVPVIVGGVYRLPRRRSDAYDRAYTVPAELHSAGVKFCISGANRFGSSNARNLPYHAATAAAFGLPPEEALRAITLAPAEILGVADRVGSLEVGKDATLFIANGDPLEAATQVTAAYVQGRPLDLTDRHKQLYEKYRTKYERQKAAAGK